MCSTSLPQTPDLMRGLSPVKKISICHHFAGTSLIINDLCVCVCVFLAASPFSQLPAICLTHWRDGVALTDLLAADGTRSRHFICFHIARHHQGSTRGRGHTVVEWGVFLSYSKNDHSTEFPCSPQVFLGFIWFPLIVQIFSKVLHETSLKMIMLRITVNEWPSSSLSSRKQIQSNPYYSHMWTNISNNP